jgi:hypothetical protein
MTLDDRWQRLDHRLEPLPLGDEAEGREDEPLGAGAFGGVGTGALGEQRRRPVRHDANLVGAAHAARDEQLARGLGHHDHELGLTTQRSERLGLTLGRLREDRVERHDEGLRELLDQREHVGAVGAAEDPVLVLEEDDVHVQPAENPCGADVIPAHGLGDRRDDPRALWPGRVVDDDDLVDAVDPVHAEERSAHVGGERADPAGTGWVGRDDRGAHGPAASFRRDSGAARSVSTAGSPPP